MADGEITMPKLGALGWARWAWRQLTSMRTALLLLLLLAVAAVPGSVLPQRPVDGARVEQFLADHPGYGPWLDRLGFYDVYASVWFSAIYLLLFVSLVGCVVPRTRQHVRALRARPPRTPRRLGHLPAHRTAVATGAPDEVLQAARAVLRRRRYRVERYDTDTDASLSAERGHLAETGNLVFHVALLGLLVGVGAGAALSWSGQALVVTGSSFADTLPGYDSFRSGARVDRNQLPPFSFTLDEMRVEFDEQSKGNQFGAPRKFEADLTTRVAPGAEPVRQLLRVNDPVTLDGVRIYLVGNGYAPVITVRDGTGAVVSSGPVPFLPRDASYTSNGVLKLPDARPSQLGLAGFLLPSAVNDPSSGMPISIFPDARNPRLIFTAWQGDLQMDTARQSEGYSVYTLDTSELTQVQAGPGEPFRAILAPGQEVELPGGLGRVTFEGVRRYAALDIRYDPTKLWVLVFAGLALGGLMLSLFVRRRRVWVRVGRDGQGRTVVEVAGLARGEDEGLALEVGSLLQELVPGAPEGGDRDDGHRGVGDRDDGDRDDGDRDDGDRDDGDRDDRGGLAPVGVKE